MGVLKRRKFLFGGVALGATTLLAGLLALPASAASAEAAEYSGWQYGDNWVRTHLVIKGQTCSSHLPLLHMSDQSSKSGDPCVAIAQHGLNVKLGKKIGEDGKWGKVTQDAIKQLKIKGNEDGKTVDYDTWAAIVPGAADKLHPSSVDDKTKKRVYEKFRYAGWYAADQGDCGPSLPVVSQKAADLKDIKTSNACVELVQKAIAVKRFHIKGKLYYIPVKGFDQNGKVAKGQEQYVGKYDQNLQWSVSLYKRYVLHWKNTNGGVGYYTWNHLLDKSVVKDLEKHPKDNVKSRPDKVHEAAVFKATSGKSKGSKK